MHAITFLSSHWQTCEGMRRMHSARAMPCTSHNPNEWRDVPAARAREMLVQWTTAERGRPMVRWGPSPGRLTEAALASRDTYMRGDMCGGARAARPLLLPASTAGRARARIALWMAAQCIQTSTRRLIWADSGQDERLELAPQDEVCMCRKARTARP